MSFINDEWVPLIKAEQSLLINIFHCPEAFRVALGTTTTSGTLLSPREWGGREGGGSEGRGREGGRGEGGSGGGGRESE